MNYFRVSHPPQIVLPIHNWKPKDEPTKEDEIGPLVEHIYEVKNKQINKYKDRFLIRNCIFYA